MELRNWVIPMDGYADGGEPYTDEECEIINKEEEDIQKIMDELLCTRGDAQGVYEAKQLNA